NTDRGAWGKFSTFNGTNVGGARLPAALAGQTYTARIKVRNDRVSATVEDAPAGYYKTDYSTAHLNAPNRVGPDALGIVSQSPVMIRNLQLTPMAGTRVDLIKLVDADRDALDGKWALHNGELTVAPSRKPSIEFPYAPLKEFHVRINFISAKGPRHVL